MLPRLSRISSKFSGSEVEILEISGAIGANSIVYKIQS